MAKNPSKSSLATNVIKSFIMPWRKVGGEDKTFKTSDKKSLNFMLSDLDGQTISKI